VTEIEEIRLLSFFRREDRHNLLITRVSLLPKLLFSLALLIFESLVVGHAAALLMLN
jgi:hypothetical protein